MTTLLQGINRLLAVNGETPVTSAASSDPAAIQARNKLEEVAEEVQGRGWWFNTEYGMTLNPTGNEIVLPENTLSVDPVSQSSAYIQRGTRLYDTKNNTFTITEPVKVNIVLSLTFPELPTQAAHYIIALARRDYYVEDDGDTAKSQMLNTKVEETFAYLQREHLKNLDVSNQTSPMGLALNHATNLSGRRRQNFAEDF